MPRLTHGVVQENRDRSKAAKSASEHNPRVGDCDGTRVIDSSDRSIALAISALRAGNIVAVPTETVYGLAADASNPGAVARVFAAKGRPVDHPLIVHLASGTNLADWARCIPDAAYRLAEEFWPGPLTLILERQPPVLDVVTGGLSTVGLRIPSHPVIQRILQGFGGGLAAPSANRFGRVSPTSAIDVCDGLAGVVGLIVDGGQCEVGVESTIVAFVGDEATILRPGGVSSEAIAQVLGRKPLPATHTSVRAPGTLASHYAPTTPLEICSANEATRRAATLASHGMRVGVLTLAPAEVPGVVVSWNARGDVGILARSLYHYLRLADSESLDILVVEVPPAHGLGVAVADRLRRAAHRPTA